MPEEKSEEMEGGNEETTVEVKVEYPTFKVSATTKTTLNQADKVISKLIDSINNSEKKIKKVSSSYPSAPVGQPPVQIDKEQITPVSQISTEDPLNRVALRLEIDYNKMKSAQLFGTKDGKVQIFKPQKFSPRDSLLVITFIYESGLGNSAIPYDELKEAFKLSNIKSKSPLYLIISNCASLGYLDKQRYDSQKEITLTSKGETQVKKVIEKAISS